MEYRELGGTNIEVSVVALGCWSFAGDAYWGPQEDRDSIATVHAALDEGVNFFDTAESYGAGHSEIILGQALEGHRDDAVIATKVSHGCGAPCEIEAACARSLQNLNTDFIDLWGYPFNRSYHMFSAWRILALASTTRARLASFKPGFEPMRTAWTTSNGCGGPTASSVRVAATKAVGAWAMAASCVRRVRHAVR